VIATRQLPAACGYLPTAFVAQSYEGLGDDHQAARLLGSLAALIVHRMPQPEQRPPWVVDLPDPEPAAATVVAGELPPPRPELPYSSPELPRLRLQLASAVREGTSWLCDGCCGGPAGSRPPGMPRRSWPRSPRTGAGVGAAGRRRGWAG
jgi:hypothetical protein